MPRQRARLRDRRPHGATRCPGRRPARRVPRCARPAHDARGHTDYTRHRNNAAAEDPFLNELVRAETPVVTIFGKSWTLHATEVLGASLAQNLDMIAGNLVGDPSSGFGTDTNKVTLYLRDGTCERLELMEKRAVADILLDRILTMAAPK